MLKVTCSIGKKCLFWHSWKEITFNEESATKYYQCQKCSTKQIIQYCHGYQPIAWWWLNFKLDLGEQNVNTTPS